jgi:hypothetical protein
MGARVLTEIIHLRSVVLTHNFCERCRFVVVFVVFVVVVTAAATMAVISAGLSSSNFAENMGIELPLGTSSIPWKIWLIRAFPTRVIPSCFS